MKLTLCFVLIDLGVPWYKTAAAEMIRSARRAYKDHDLTIVQLTDNQTAHCPDADGVFNLEIQVVTEQLAQAKGHLMAEFALQAQEPVIFCDVDLIWNNDSLLSAPLMAPVGCLWRTDFQCMPFNTGIVMTQPGQEAFWKAYRRACKSLPDEMQMWWGDQVAMTAADAVCKGMVGRLPMKEVAPALDVLPNFPLATPAVHFKGDRKPLMVPYARLLDDGDEFDFVRPTVNAADINIEFGEKDVQRIQGFTF